jgi:hypothetical protein
MKAGYYRNLLRPSEPAWSEDLSPILKAGDGSSASDALILERLPLGGGEEEV